MIQSFPLVYQVNLSKMKIIFSFVFFSFTLFNHIECAAADTNQQLDVYTKLCDVVDSRSKRAHFEFREILECNAGVKLSGLQVGSLVSLILDYQVNVRGASMIIALRNLRRFDYNGYTMTRENLFPLTIATTKAFENPKGGLKLVEALLDAGASPQILCDDKGTVKTIMQFWREKMIKDMETNGYSSTDCMEEALRCTPLNIRPFQEEKWSKSAQIYGYLSYANRGSKASTLTTKEKFQKMQNSREHICTCKYCFLPFT